MERMENDKIVKRVNVGECVGSSLLDRPRHRWIHTMKDCLKIKRSLNVRQAWRMVYGSSIWQGFVRGNVLEMNH